MQWQMGALPNIVVDRLAGVVDSRDLAFGADANQKIDMFSCLQGGFGQELGGCDGQAVLVFRGVAERGPAAAESPDAAFPILRRVAAGL